MHSVAGLSYACVDALPAIWSSMAFGNGGNCPKQFSNSVLLITGAAAGDLGPRRGCPYAIRRTTKRGCRCHRDRSSAARGGRNRQVGICRSSPTPYAQSKHPNRSAGCGKGVGQFVFCNPPRSFTQRFGPPLRLACFPASRAAPARPPLPFRAAGQTCPTAHRWPSRLYRVLREPRRHRCQNPSRLCPSRCARLDGPKRSSAECWAATESKPPGCLTGSAMRQR